MEIEFKKVSSTTFHNLTFKIEKGSIIGITGAQKTDFLALLDYKETLNGEATYQGLAYNKTNIYTIKKGISLIETKWNNQFFLSTVEEHFVFFIHYYHLKLEDPRKKVVSALKMVGLTEEYLEKDLIVLSSSEQKLLQIAIALLSNPTVLLLDEPFINLDMKSQKKIERLLLKLKERYQKTIIIASHNSNLLYNLTEKMLFLKNGTILRQGETKEIYQNVKFLTRYHYEVPDIVLFTYKAKEIKNVKIDYHKDIRDLIKDIYKHV